MYRSTSVLLIALAVPLGSAGDAALDRATLRGLKAVNVVIDPVAQDMQQEGATQQALRARLEDRLRQAGIPLDSASHDFVALRLTSVRAGRGPFAIAVTIGLYQPVLLARDPNIRTATQTWEVETVVLAGAKEVLRASLDSVDELSARFVAAYRSVNGQ